MSGQDRCFYSLVEAPAHHLTQGQQEMWGNLQAFAENLQPLGKHEFTHAEPVFSLVALNMPSSDD